MPPSDFPATPSLTETLADLNILWVLVIVAGLSVLRLALVNSRGEMARSASQMLESGITALVLVYLILRPFFIQAFFIPSPSMEPTLIGDNNVGDKILVNKFAYRLQKPHHDDVVVFLAPPAAMEGDPEFIKRVIGLPGDRLEVIGGHLSINGTAHTHGDVRQKLTDAGECGSEAQADSGDDSQLQADCHVKFVSDGVLVRDNSHPAKMISKERLAEIYTHQKGLPVTIQPGYVVRNGEKLEEPFTAEDPDYDMKIIRGQPLKHLFGPYEGYLWDGGPITQADYLEQNSRPTEPLPAGQYLMMGDNRNDSSDGTNWGTLPQHRLVGKALLVFWPPPRIGIVH